MLFKYRYNVEKDCPSVYIDARHITNEHIWQQLRDVIGAFKLSLDCNCHVEFEPVKTYISNLIKLHKNNPIIKIDIYLETWKAKATKFNKLSEITD